MTDITELAQSLKAAAEKASNGDWVKESGDGWEACCSANDQANGGFIIAHFEGPDAAENREFVQAANPANIRALVEALEKAQQRIAELEEAEQKLCAANVTLDARAELAERQLAELESRTVKLPKPKNSDQGWKIDPEFINKVQDAIGYDDTCECWEGTPSMELVEAVILAAAGIKVEAE
ncbi:ead/Ea22-like family protein [Klebsiella pneumoniae]